MVVLVNHSIRSLRLVPLGQMESIRWQQMLKEMMIVGEPKTREINS
jgi:hypothetical protein